MTALGLILPLLSLLVVPSAPTHGLEYTAVLNGSNVVPPTPSAGSASVQWYWNENRDEIVTTVIYRGLSGPVLNAFLVNGRDSETWTIVRIIASGAFPSGSSFYTRHDGVEYTLMVLDSLDVIINTPAYPAGEVRGHFVNTTQPATDDCTWGLVRALYR